MLLLVEHSLQADDTTNDLVGRRLVHTSLDIGSSIDAERVAGRRYRIVEPHYPGRREWVRDQEPRMVERGIFRVILLPLALDVRDRIRRRWQTVEDREPVTHELAMVDEGVLHGDARSAGRSDDADLLVIAHGAQAGALLGDNIVEPDVRIVVDRGDGIVAAT